MDWVVLKIDSQQSWIFAQPLNLEKICISNQTGSLLHWFPRLYDNVFELAHLTTSGDFIDFEQLFNLVKYTNVSTPNCNLKKG